MQTLNNTQQRWLALALLFGIIFLFCAIIFIPWYSALNEKLDDIDDQIFNIKRYERVIASREEVLVKVELGRKQITGLNYSFAQETYSLAAAELQKKLKVMVEGAGGEINSTQALPYKEQDSIIRIAVKVKLSGDMNMLKKLLYDIEVDKPLVSIEDMTILPQRARRNRKTRVLEESGKLTITMEVASYTRKTDDAN